MRAGEPAHARNGATTVAPAMCAVRNVCIRACMRLLGLRECATRWPWLWPYEPPPASRSESTRRVYPPYSMYIDP